MSLKCPKCGTELTLQEVKPPTPVTVSGKTYSQVASDPGIAFIQNPYTGQGEPAISDSYLNSLPWKNFKNRAGAWVRADNPKCNLLKESLEKHPQLAFGMWHYELSRATNGTTFTVFINRYPVEKTVAT